MLRTERSNTWKLFDLVSSCYRCSLLKPPLNACQFSSVTKYTFLKGYKHKAGTFVQFFTAWPAFSPRRGSSPVYVGVIKNWERAGVRSTNEQKIKYHHDGKKYSGLFIHEFTWHCLEGIIRDTWDIFFVTSIFSNGRITDQSSPFGQRELRAPLLLSLTIVVTRTSLVCMLLDSLWLVSWNTVRLYKLTTGIPYLPAEWKLISKAFIHLFI